MIWLAATIIFLSGFIFGMYLVKAITLLQVITKELKQIKTNTKRDKGIAQTLQPINKPVETDHIVRSYNPKQVAAEVQRKYEERSTL